MIPFPFMRRSVYCSGILLLLNLYCCEWIICEANNDTVFRPLEPNQLKEFLTDLLAKNNTQWKNCPAPKLPVTDEDCRSKRCNNDEDCNNQTCCFNGCVFTCTRQIAPPAVIDWYEEPKMNSVFTSDSEMRPCSTSPRPAPSEPVGCPIGYVCRVESSDDPFEGILSTGVCVPDVTAGYSSFDDDSLFREHLGKGTVYLPGGCVLTAKQYDHMQKFMLRSYVVDCFCIEGSVECKVTL